MLHLVTRSVLQEIIALLLNVSTRIQAQYYFYTQTSIFTALVPKPEMLIVLTALMQIKKNDLFFFPFIFI